MRLIFALALVVAFNVIALEATCPGSPGQQLTPDPIDYCNIVVGSGLLFEDILSVPGYIGPAQQRTGSPEVCCIQCKTYRLRTGGPECGWWIKTRFNSIDEKDCYFFSQQPTVVSGLGGGYAWGTSPSQGGSGR